MRAVFAILLASLAAAPAAAHDSRAPAGALHSWLPKEDWVYRHWVPFDEWRLKRHLGLRGRELEAYLFDDHRTLAQLARRRGIDAGELADELVAPMRGIPGADLALLRARTLRILRQGHLAQHLFFHAYHGIDMRTPAPQVFGLSGGEYYALRKAGGTPAEAAERGGRPLDSVRWGMRAAFAADLHEGVRLGVADPVEQEILLARREAQLECWLRRPLPVFDPGHPYGDRFKWHGRHDAGDRDVPGRVERARRALPPSCWSPPPRRRGAGAARARPAALCRLSRRPPARPPRSRAGSR